MLKKILAALSVLGAGVASIFYVLYRQAKEERKVINEKYDDMTKNVDALEAAETAEKELKKIHEELVTKAHSGSNLDSFNACNDLLSK
jgi:hypothetical protein